MEKFKRSLGSFAVPLLSILMAFLIGGIIMAALGADPFQAVKYLFQGAFGSRANIGTTLNKSTPLMFTALCACFAYKCGVFNLGGEGQFLMGSIAAFLTAYFSGLTGFAGILLALLAGTLAGGIWGMIPGVLKITRGQNEMIISIMLNYVATLFMGVLYTSWIRDENIPQTPAISKLVQLPRVVTGMRFTWGFVLAIAVGLLMYYVLFWTSGGFKLRAVGYNMTASRFNGIPVKRYILTSFIISGAIAGLGGGAELLGTQFRLINGFGAGYGFEEAAKYVAEQEGKTVELLPVPYANSFSDAPKGKEFATELISQGADVFFGDASAVDSGAREAIDDANTAAGSIKIYDIGQPADILGQNPCIICSQVTDNSAMIVASMEAVEAGNFGGNTVYGTLENGTLSAGAINTELVPAEIVEKYNAYLQQMIDGTFMK